MPFQVNQLDFPTTGQYRTSNLSMGTLFLMSAYFVPAELYVATVMFAGHRQPQRLQHGLDGRILDEGLGVSASTRGTLYEGEFN